jgi:hypothetical protein
MVATAVGQFARRAAADARILYFDTLPDACVRALDAANDLGLCLQTASETDALAETIRDFRPSVLILAMRGAESELEAHAGYLGQIGAPFPILLAGDRDVSTLQNFMAGVDGLGLDLRGTVRIGERLRDLQLILLSAAK